MRFLSTTSTTLFLFLLLSKHLQAYTPVDHFTISCGTTGSSFDGKRTWTGDIDSNFSSHQNDTFSANATTAQSLSTNQVPYAIARLSRSQFNYSFHVTAGPKLLRLFFYPTEYPFFSRIDASFSVQSNQFILLNGFNASLNADAEGTETIFREYVVNVNDGERLNLSFTPSQSNSYAFINGIEVLSMPSDLYYTSGNDTRFVFMGNYTPYRVGNRAALETVYRINVGGQEIQSQIDTGFFRNWAGHEENYLIKQNLQYNDLPADSEGRNITVNPDYVAPQELYRTARNMGINATMNKISNLTWEFPVDSGFTYMIRLHFCELDSIINEDGDRVFFIYIANQLADDHADVMRWSQNQKGLAVQKNYAVLVPKNNTKKKVNLSLQMHPQTDDKATYSDVFLNGLEIFKISDTFSNILAGPNPDSVQTPKNNIPRQKGKSSSLSRMKIIGVITGPVSVVILIFVVISLVVFLRLKRPTNTKTKDYKSKSTTTHDCSLPSDLCRRFSLIEIKAATQNFDDIFIIGVGGFGHVHKGYIDDGSIPVPSSAANRVHNRGFASS